MSNKPGPMPETPSTAPYFKELWAKASRTTKVIVIAGLSIMSVAETVFYGKMLWAKMGWGAAERAGASKEETS